MAGPPASPAGTTPTARLLPDVLDRCSWQYSEPGRHDLTAGLGSTNSVSENMLVMVPFWGRIYALLHLPVHSSTDLHRSDYTAVMSQAKDILNDSRIRFAFVHLPVPHPPGVFNRRLHTLSDQGTYLDNLVLADQSLGQLRSILQSMLVANNTTLTLSSDHSWRTLMWRPTEDWSPGGIACIARQLRSLPVLMVKFPGSVAGQVVAKAVDALVLHRILEDLLRGHMHSPMDLKRSD